MVNTILTSFVIRRAFLKCDEPCKKDTSSINCRKCWKHFERFNEVNCIKSINKVITGSLKETSKEIGDSVRLRGNLGKLQEIQRVFYQQRTL